jgi:hypothetical protein
MPAKGDGITKRKDGRYMARYTVHTADGPKRKTIYGIKYKDVEKKLNAGRRGGSPTMPGSRPLGST